MQRSRIINHAKAATILTTITASLVSASDALAQSNVDPADKWSWGENIGFMNWRDANGGAQGVVVGQNILAGFIWAENVGWINVGDGSPDSGSQYSNATGQDAGVNILNDGFLAGLAWGENIGWINFATEPFIGADGARLQGGRLRGFAWAENAGWINLDDAEIFVGLNCPADLNADGVVDGADLGLLLGAWGPAGGQVDLNGDGVVDGADLGLLLGAWGACP